MPQKIEDMSFEQAMAELETVVRQLESGKTKLDEAVAVYERGVRLRDFCMKKLESAKSKIDKLIIGKDGTIIGKEDFDHDIKD